MREEADVGGVYVLRRDPGFDRRLHHTEPASAGVVERPMERGDFAGNIVTRAGWRDTEKQRLRINHCGHSRGRNLGSVVP